MSHLLYPRFFDDTVDTPSLAESYILFVFIPVVFYTVLYYEFNFPLLPTSTSYPSSL